MVLKGSIGTFDIISIIQMVSSQQVTGMLHIKGPGKNDTFGVLIDKGMFVRAVPAGEPTVTYIARRLRKAELLGSGQHKVLTTGIKKEGMSESDIPKRFSVPVSDMKRLILSVTYESLHSMFAFKTGTYEFEPRTIEYDPQLCEPMNTEFVLMESSRILDEVLHSNWKYRDGTVFQRTQVPGAASPQQTSKKPAQPEKPEEEFIIERTSVTTPDAAPAAEQKQPEEVSVRKSPGDGILELADGIRTLGDIYAMSLMSKNEVILELAALLNAGKLTVLHTPEQPPVLRKASLFLRITDVVKGALMLAATIAILLTILYYSRINPLKVQEGRGGITYSNFLKYIGTYQQIKLSNALEIYKLEYGSYPPKLTSLVRQRILSDKDLTFPYGSEYYYNLEDGNYILLAPKYAAK